MADDTRPPERAATESTGWARNERDRLAIGLDATPAERLAWLEDMLRLAARTGALPRGPDDAGRAEQP